MPDLENPSFAHPSFQENIGGSTGIQAISPQYLRTPKNHCTTQRSSGGDLTLSRSELHTVART